MDKAAPLSVFYNGEAVGTLLKTDNGIYFSYSPHWLKNGFSISPRSLPLEERAFHAPGIHYEGLFGVFADSLPGGWGTRLAIRALAKKGIAYETLSPLEKLSYLGEDGLGALFYSPTKSLLREQEEDYEKLALAAMHFCEEKKDVDIDALFQNAGSSGGARPKAHLLIEGEEWIVKFWERKDPLSLGRMEYDYALAAKACGIPISDCRLLPSSCCEGYFATKRFDRKGGRRLHVLSLGGFLESPHFLPNLDYVTFLQSTAFLTRSNKEVLKAYRLACFNVFAQNRDDHSKNFSFLYDEEKRSYVLAPAYDLTFTPNIKEHEMTCCGNGNPGEDDLFALAETMSIPKENAEKAIKGIKEIVESKLGKWIRGNS